MKGKMATRKYHRLAAFAKKNPAIYSLLLPLHHAAYGLYRKIAQKKAKNAIKTAPGSMISKKARFELCPDSELVLESEARISEGAGVSNMLGAVHLGKRVGLSANTIVSGPVLIDDYTMIGPNCYIGGYDHNYEEGKEAEPKIKENPNCNIRILPQKGYIISPIYIGKHAWIGANCCVMKGVTIGEHSVISAGSVVTKDVPPFSLAAGNPAKVIKKLQQK